MKRIVLFVLTNFAVMIMLAIVVNVFGFDRYLTRRGIDYPMLMMFSLVWGFGGAIISLLMSRAMAKSAMGLQMIDGKTGHAELDWLYQTIEQLTRKAGLPMPEVGVWESADVNAFATGPSKRSSLVAVSTGLLRSMRHEEVEAVLAHEVSHIANGDMVTMTLIQGVVNAFSIFLSRVVAGLMRSRDDRGGNNYMLTMLLQIAFSFLGMFIVRWFSRTREFRADAGAATLSSRGNMIAALQRLQINQGLVDNSQPQLATMKINGPKGGGFAALMATHPPLEARIAALQQGR